MRRNGALRRPTIYLQASRSRTSSGSLSLPASHPLPVRWNEVTPTTFHHSGISYQGRYSTINSNSVSTLYQPYPRLH